MNRLLRNLAIATVAATISLTAFPAVTVQAAVEGDPVQPPRLRRFAEFRLEQAWRRQLRVYEFLGQMLERADTLISRAEARIDELAAEGKDVAELQSALSAFGDAVGDIPPIYQGLNGLVSSHPGFDSLGRVADVEHARETVKAMQEGLAEIKETMGGTWQKLIEALREFRRLNPPVDDGAL